jgi:hypothetical protein
MVMVCLEFGLCFVNLKSLQALEVALAGETETAELVGTVLLARALVGCFALWVLPEVSPISFLLKIVSTVWEERAVAHEVMPIGRVYKITQRE